MTLQILIEPTNVGPDSDIGDPLYCSDFIASKHSVASNLLAALQEFGLCDPRVAFTLLHNYVL